MIMELTMLLDIIKCLKSPIQSEIIHDDFILGSNKWKKKISTSPLGRHLGHYKLIITDGNNESSKHAINPLDNLLIMMNLPIKYGFAPTGWCKSITVMIEKDAGSPKIEKLQMIHLFKADYNFVVTVLWGRQNALSTKERIMTASVTNNLHTQPPMN